MDEETKILALTECLILWDYLAETGEDDRRAATRILWNEGKLSLPDYDCDCPFCEYLRDNDGWFECENCLWPGEGDMRCTNDSSPFQLWARAETSCEDRKAAARQVLELLKTIEI